MLLTRNRIHKNHHLPAQARYLSDVQPGRGARVKGFAPGLSIERWARLQAYGLTPGSMVQVVQHYPVTIVRVDFTEVAMESDLARLIEIC